ncbi:hypothetical protein GUITHDRAFT_147147 [Guillardia theta CCMP2712]|uniref:Uncharacterized protein n=2 Tax=Guillardia theta TaxID=55529 RepID=L1IFA6_GUITC|nr:hypothetical protein GUITHDRAFT_147147 [Guillardia theta CCMP2712]EKX34535.1 hypothetical protein GUITHDRAFT_147147 [Guillardia theta CCMP2712]|eukprot:XP_005821515.1 hypothetical protein GUITHDRAFT_147147 [Guillardia theta CCMP2712]
MKNDPKKPISRSTASVLPTAKQTSFLLLGITMGLFISQNLFYIVMNKKILIKRSDMKQLSPSPKSQDQPCPDWLLFSVIRSAILQAERKLERDLDVVSLKKDISVSMLRCQQQGNMSVCDADLRLNVVSLHNLEGMAIMNEVLPYQNYKRSTVADRSGCNISLDVLGAIHQSSVQVDVICRQVKSRITSLAVLVPLVGMPEVNEEWLLSVLAEWVTAADTLFLDVDVVFIAGGDGEAVRQAVARGYGEEELEGDRMRAREQGSLPHHYRCIHNSQGSVNVIVLTPPDPSECSFAHGDDVNRTLCQVAVGFRQYKQLCDNVECLHEYVLQQGAGFTICREHISEFLKALLAVRRSFSAVRCGPELSCFLVNANDVSFWSSHLQPPVLHYSHEFVFQLAQGMTKTSQAYFADSSLLVFRLSLVQASKQMAGADQRLSSLTCSQLLSRTHFPGSSQLDELYSEDTGCVISIDSFSPCLDKEKSIQTLTMPHWFRRAPPPARAISVQIITKDRPELLYKTLMKLVEQTRPACITVHIDSMNELDMTDKQRKTLRTVQWFSRMYGILWRRNPNGFHPSIMRRLGFRRNYVGYHKDATKLFPTDRLVHMTWNALAYAFDSPSTPSECSRNATVVLEDDLLPADDLLSFLEFGYCEMLKDPNLMVVSAWNDNSYNIRPGLQCAVQRGEYFMSLGWLTTRAVYEQVMSPSLWPVSDTSNRDEDKIQTLTIIGGWETPFLNIFKGSRSGLFPVVSRVFHQPSSSGWSVTKWIQSQVLDVQSFQVSSKACAFEEVREETYDRKLALKFHDGVWVSLEHTRCFKDLLIKERSTTYLVALSDTQRGRSPNFASILYPFSLISGIGKVRGYYKDMVMVHVAHHTIFLVGPHAPVLERNGSAQSLFAKLAMSSEQALNFFNSSCKHDKTIILPAVLAAANQGRTTSPFVLVVAGRPREDCDTVCKHLSRVCTTWGAIYASIPNKLQGRSAARSLNPSKSPLFNNKPTAYGDRLAEVRNDLPVLHNQSLLTGPIRLFRCSANTEPSNKRICPCFTHEFVASEGHKKLF